MEKVFSWPVLVSICAVFIVVWISLQAVTTMRLEAEASMIGDRIFSWSWPAENLQSRAEITEASIIHKGDNDAVVKVSGKQTLIVSSNSDSAGKADEAPGQEKPGEKPLDLAGNRSETVECSAVLTLYRQSGKWVLGRVEL